MDYTDDPLSALDNHLIAAQSVEVHARLLPHLEPFALELGQVSYESGDTMGHVILARALRRLGPSPRLAS